MTSLLYTVLKKLQCVMFLLKFALFNQLSAVAVRVTCNIVKTFCT